MKPLGGTFGGGVPAGEGAGHEYRTADREEAPAEVLAAGRR